MEKGIWQKRSGFLSQALIFSVALNVALLATFGYFLLRGQKAQVAFASPPSTETVEKTINNAEILRLLCEKNFSELVELLSDKQNLEDGYLKRDFALAILVSFHQFHLEKALNGAALQQRQILFSRHPQGESIDLAIFPGLTDEHYEAIIKYARTEKWPLTSQGLFFEIKRALATNKTPDLLLIESFALSPEYISITTLFSRSGAVIPKEELFELVTQGDWQTLNSLYEQQKQSQDLSVDRCRTLLVDYLQQHSKKAAQLLLRCDSEFTLKRLTDDQVLFVLDNANLAEKHAMGLAKALLCSTRGENVIRVAAGKLYAQAGEAMPNPFQLLDAIKRFCPGALPKAAPALEKPVVVAPPPSPMEKSQKSQMLYIVQSGDSLWKIAKKHRVSIEAIVKANHLETERLKPGQQLQIPQKN